MFQLWKNIHENNLDEGVTKRKYRQRIKAKQKGLLKGDAEAIKSRGLTEFSCKKFQYLTGQDENGKWCQIANYCDEYGNIVAQKLNI